MKASILGEVGANDMEEIDTIIAELEVSKGRGNLILCVVNAPAYRDGIIRALSRRFRSKVIPVEEGEDVIQSLNMFRDLGDNGGVAISLAQSAALEEKEGNLRRALDQIRKAKTMFLEMGNPTAAQARQYEEWLEKKIANEQI